MPPKQSSSNVIVIDKTGTLKATVLKEYKQDELYKKCGLKTPDGFAKHTEWKVKLDGQTYYISMYGKLEGRANMENKYDFPPPIDTKLFFGSCLLVGETATASASASARASKRSMVNLTIDLWDRIYEKLFGGFEDLTLAVEEDDNEEDELAHVPKCKKTKQGGYLKDGFVVDDDDDASSYDDGDDDDDDVEDEVKEEEPKEEDIVLEDIGSELSEEEYEYSDDEEE